MYFYKRKIKKLELGKLIKHFNINSRIYIKSKKLFIKKALKLNQRNYYSHILIRYKEL